MNIFCGVKTRNKSILAALIGHILERYDLSIYGYYATILAIHFFPDSAGNAITLSMAVFIISYFMRPVGGIIFGYCGDKFGRKKAFIYSMLIALISTFCVAFLPRYETIGISACIILLVCRMLQSICAGGEFSGVGIYIGEHIGKNHPGLYAGLITATGLMGAALSTLIGTLTTLPFMPNWGWRLPFIFGVILTGIGVHLRRSMLETPEFIQMYNTKNTCKIPFKEIIHKYKLNIVYALFIGGCGHMILYTALLYPNIIYSTQLILPNFQIMLINTSILMIWIILSPLAGRMADQVGIINLMSSTLIVISILIIPLFNLCMTNMTLPNIIIFQIILSILGVFYVAPIAGLFTSLFPVHVRHTGVSFGITLGQALLGSTTPLLIQKINLITNSYVIPGLYISFICLVTIWIFHKPLRKNYMKHKLISSPIS